MHIAICKIKLSLPANHDLKGKRKVVQSLIGKIRAKYNVAIAEVNNNDLLQIASLGITTVSNDSKELQKVMMKIIDNIREYQGDYYLIDHSYEILTEPE